MRNGKRKLGMLTPSKTLIRLDSSVRHSFIQANTYPVAWPDGRCCGESHTEWRKSLCSHV